MKSESSEGIKIGSKGALAIALSKLKVFSGPQVRAEQYPCDSEIAAKVLWEASMRENLRKVSADLGCGTGILGIGLLLLGAKKVHLVDSDESALTIAKENMQIAKSEFGFKGEAVFHCMDVSDFQDRVELIVQNPPFGVKVRHADRIFLEKAIEIGKVIYSFHKSESEGFIEKFARDGGFLLDGKLDFAWPLKASYEFHRRKIKYIPVTCFRLIKKE